MRQQWENPRSLIRALSIGGRVKTSYGRLLPAAIAAALFQPVYAHHSAAAFNNEAEVTVTGIVSQYSFRNPHVYLNLELAREDGSTVSMEVEAGAASVIGPLGFTRDSIKVGDRVTVHGNPGRRD